VKQYRAAYKDCQQCPLKANCVPHSQFKQVIRSAFDAAYRRAWHRQHTRQGKHMRRVRQRTVEPVFGSLLQHYSLRRVNTKGRAAAHKTMLITAIAYNLRKLLKHQSTRMLSLALALRPAQHGLLQALFSRRFLTGYRSQSALESRRPIAWSSATATNV
ncbi:MAG: hypothetical protein EOO61_22880, partial [Hymenobacter sp.]